MFIFFSFAGAVNTWKPNSVGSKLEPKWVRSNQIELGGTKLCFVSCTQATVADI